MSHSRKGIVNDWFGSRRGLLSCGKYYIQERFGAFAAYRNIQWERVGHFVFVCQGNICRSPLAAEYSASLGVNSESFGTSCADGLPADPRALEYAAHIGIDLSGHRTRSIQHMVPREGDLIVVMEPAHLPAVAHLGLVAQVTLAGLWLPYRNPYIHDPYSANQNYFQRCEDHVVYAVKGMLAAR